MAVDEQVGDIGSSGNDGILSLFVQFCKCCHDFLYLAIIEGMAVNLVLKFVVVDIVGEVEHLLRLTTQQCFHGFFQ